MTIDFLEQAADGKLEVLGLAAFSVAGNAIHPLMRHAQHERFKGWTSAQVEAEILRLKRRKE